MKFNPDMVDIAIKAYAGGLTIKEIATDFLHVSERTLYHWIAEGRKSYKRAVVLMEIPIDELSHIERLKMDLFESMRRARTKENLYETYERLETRIGEVKFEKANAEYRALRRAENADRRKQRLKELKESKASYKRSVRARAKMQ